MADAHDAVESAIEAATKARSVISKGKTDSVSAIDDKSLAKATALTWLRSHRPTIAPFVGAEDLKAIDDAYTSLLECTERRALRSKYKELLRSAKRGLVAIRPKIALGHGTAQASQRSEQAPDFSPLTADASMQAILVRRWRETIRCIDGGAPLAATVMMGGLLEAILLARVHRLHDKKPVFKAKHAPSRGGKTLPLQEWTLQHYIDVAHDLGWISHSAKSVGEVLRDYRNYVHPYKEWAHGVQLNEHDADMFWSVSRAMVKQIIASI